MMPPSAGSTVCVCVCVTVLNHLECVVSALMVLFM